MSKFGDKLSRLHASRVRALETDANGDEKRVFVAEPEASSEAPPVVENSAPKQDTPARQAVRQQLEIGERLGARASSRKPRMQMTRSNPDVAPVQRPPVMGHVAAGTAIGERLSDLRRQADALVTAGGVEHALPLLHEIVALSPTHPWALKHLAAYWNGRGESTLATYYADRLALVAPY